MSDNLSLIMYAVDNAKENGEVVSVTMNGKQLRDLTLSPSIVTALEYKGYKPTKPNVIDQSVIEFILGGKIIIENIEGIRIRTEKETEVKFHN